MVDRSAVDIYTVAHFSFGYLAKRSGFSTDTIMVLTIVYELVEDKLIQDLKLQRIGWTAETKTNALVDLLASYVGAQLAK